MKYRDRINLIRLYLVAVEVDIDGIVNHQIRVSTTSTDVGLSVSCVVFVAYLLDNFHFPLKDIHAREVFEESILISFHHHMSQQGVLFLLVEIFFTIGGIGLQPDLCFDIVAVANSFNCDCRGT
ncbi:MAG: hypothetical protein ROW48_10655 [Bellilinea sp.]|jgi:predicted unusual protein kinase regulating ubiquinone biosynthesis (AarF/ABC1/UbiB family)